MTRRLTLLWSLAGWYLAALPLAAQDPPDTALARLAASLKPGAWGELKTEGLTRELTQTSKGYSIFGWSDDGIWDPTTQQFLFMGFRQEFKFIAYAEKTNAWRTLPTYESKALFGHPYGNNALDPATGTYYHLSLDEPGVVRAFDSRKEQWSNLPPCPTVRAGLALSLEFFPEMNSLLLLYQKQVNRFDLKTQKWSVLAKELPVGRDHVQFRYLARHKCILAAGGGTAPEKLVVIDATGNVVAKKDAPVKLGMGGPYNATIPDPATGDVLVLSTKDDFYAFDPTQDTWTKLGTTAKDTPLKVACVIGAPIEKYGVTMWVEGYSAAERHVWLYKHKKPTAK